VNIGFAWAHKILGDGEMAEGRMANAPDGSETAMGLLAEERLRRQFLNSEAVRQALA